jgi:hypothetical protein
MFAPLAAEYRARVVDGCGSDPVAEVFKTTLEAQPNIGHLCGLEQGVLHGILGQIARPVEGRTVPVTLLDNGAEADFLAVNSGAPLP